MVVTFSKLKPPNFLKNDKKKRKKEGRRVRREGGRGANPNPKLVTSLGWVEVGGGRGGGGG